MTLGSVEENINRGMEAARVLANAGLAPYCPHLSHYYPWNGDEKYDLEFWLEIDYPWLICCDALLRLEGESRGADREAAYASLVGIPVFYSTEELLEWIAQTAGPQSPGNALELNNGLNGYK